jgi:hypothetical protein
MNPKPTQSLGLKIADRVVTLLSWGLVIVIALVVTGMIARGLWIAIQFGWNIDRLF